MERCLPLASKAAGRCTNHANHTARGFGLWAHPTNNVIRSAWPDLSQIRPWSRYAMLFLYAMDVWDRDTYGTPHMARGTRACTVGRAR